MYNYRWDETTNGYILTTQTGRFVANEIRPVFAPELSLTGLEKRFEYDKTENRPLLWAQRNEYLLNGEKIVKMNGTQYGKSLSPEYLFEGKLKLEPVDIESMVAVNAAIMDIIIADTKRRTKELHDKDIGRCDTAYIAFSGGKDSVALLDICHRVLPLSVPVIFSDTDMELPDTYKIWEEIQKQYPEREFICAKAEFSALENWRRFAPPSRTIKWCCSVHKSSPALTLLRDKLHKPAIKAMAFVGVRGDESHSRSFYEDATDGKKNSSQLNRMPILDWGAHELWLYIFANDLMINCAYRKGLTRVGCLMCPESSEKYEWFVDKAYPRLLKPYSDIIIETSAKSLSNTKEKNDYIGKRYWQARRSGTVLKDSISMPLETHDELLVTFQSPHFSKNLFDEWIKTIGMIFKERETGDQWLKLPNSLDEKISFNYNAPFTGGGIITFEFQDDDQKLKSIQTIRELLRKVSACVACQNCEAECLTGAITVKKGNIEIDGDNCTQCHRCYKVDKSCWRYMSLHKSETSNSTMNAIAGYRNFGLRETWIDVICDKGDKFFMWDSTHPLGKDMVESAKRWFSQALIVSDGTRKPTPLLDLLRKRGCDDTFAWELIWMALVNKSPLMKWFITSTSLGVAYESQKLLDLLREEYPMTTNAKDRRLDPLKNTMAESPIGKSAGMVDVEFKGKNIKSLMRRPKDVNSLSVLYGLYLISSEMKRSNFTIRELMRADKESVYISPITAFGISADTFKKQCEGLKSKYPQYIETTFTHGNDEVTVFPSKYSIEDILALALRE